MKNLISIFAVSLLVASCGGDSKKDTELATQHLLDSVKASNAVTRALDSVAQLNAAVPVAVENVSVQTTQPAENHEHHGTSHHNNTTPKNTPATTNAPQTLAQPATEVGGTAISPGANNAPAATAPVTPEKKGASSQTKGALIGAGAGVVTGAAAGAIIDKNNPGKGAVIGGLIGGAVGSGVGLGAGMIKDKKDKAASTSTVK